MNRVRFGAALTLIVHWGSSIRNAMSGLSCVKEHDSAEIQHVDISDAPVKSETGTAVNAQLILACVVFGAASFLFGFDDKIISPVAALPAFVSSPAHIVKDKVY